MLLFDKYDNEQQFRDNFVKPLLNRMGFFAVAHIHGQHEFGKDFVFSELNRFGVIRHLAAQVKHEKKIHQTQTTKIDGILNQINQAFTVPFKLADSPRERHVSAVYVFNSGEITDNAQEYMLRKLEKESYGDNVHFFGGDRLDDLNRWITYQHDQDIRNRLQGLRIQLLLNSVIWKRINQNPEAEAMSEGSRSILAGIEYFLSWPTCLDFIDLNTVIQIWQRARIIDTICERYTISSGIFIKGEIRTRDFEALGKVTGEAQELAAKVIEYIDKALSSLKSL